MSLHGRLRGGNDRRPITVQNRDWIVIGFYIARIVIGFLVLVFAFVRRNSSARFASVLKIGWGSRAGCGAESRRGRPCRSLSLVSG